MTTKQVVFDSGGTSPLRISASGVDVDGAEFADLLFDANQSPLRLLQSGMVAVPAIQYDNLAPARIVPVALANTFPSGKAPLFCCVIRETYAGFGSALAGQICTPRRLSGGGAGGAVSNNRFFGINFNKNVPSGVITPTYSHYMIFRNYA